MPSNYIKTLHDEGYGSIATLEKRWEEAKEAAEEQGRKDDYAYITGILKRSLGIKAATRKPFKLNAAKRILDANSR